MSAKKLALYVEGQTEQVFLNRLIQEWWCYEKIQIRNIKLFAEGQAKSKVPNYPASLLDESIHLFLIVDVHGEGSLVSGIARQANRQHQEGYRILGLRDLYADDYKAAILSQKNDAGQVILAGIKNGLRALKCLDLEKIEIFFSVMEIEAWLLAFSDALSKWGKGKISKIPINLESIPRPSVMIKEIAQAAGRGDPKSFHEITSFVSFITREAIQEVYESHRIPSFTRFWKKILSLIE